MEEPVVKVFVKANKTSFDITKDVFYEIIQRVSYKDNEYFVIIDDEDVVSTIHSSHFAH